MRIAFVLAALALLTGCAGTDVTPLGVASPAGSPASSELSAAPSARSVQTVTLVVQGGRVTGDTGRVQVSLGSTVDLQVNADVAQQVHVHGYDLTVDTIPNETVDKQFVATLAGFFEVELEPSKTPLTRLQVR